MTHRKRNIVFILFSDKPTGVLQKIEETRGIDNYRISKDFRFFDITDTYYDIFEKSNGLEWYPLKTKKYSLRLRIEQEGKKVQRILTLKGPSTIDENDIPTKLEIEGALNNANLEYIIKKLKELLPLEIPIKEKFEIEGKGNLEDLELSEDGSIKLKSVQCRVTNRKQYDISTKKIVPIKKDGSPILI